QKCPAKFRQLSGTPVPKRRLSAPIGGLKVRPPTARVLAPTCGRNRPARRRRRGRWRGTSGGRPCRAAARTDAPGSLSKTRQVFDAGQEGGHPAAVDRQRLARDVARKVGDEEERRPGDLVG